jgi:hypothetical protein
MPMAVITLPVHPDLRVMWDETYGTMVVAPRMRIRIRGDLFISLGFALLGCGLAGYAMTLS